jgi:hypothetical protein
VPVFIFGGAMPQKSGHGGLKRKKAWESFVPVFIFGGVTPLAWHDGLKRL